jgi:LysM repeat protein
VVIHIVEPGESLTSIGALYGVTPQAIRQANHITDPNLLRIGQKLIIPAAR